MDSYLKDKKWKRVLCVENRAQRLERLLSGCISNTNGARLSNSNYTGIDFDRICKKNDNIHIYSLTDSFGSLNRIINLTMSLFSFQKLKYTDRPLYKVRPISYAFTRL